MTTSDSEAIALSLREPDRFVAVFERHASAVHAYLARRAGYQGAEDLSAEVWLQAFRARHTYDDVWPDARPWLYGIARNTLRHYWRRRSAEPAAPLEAAHDPWPDVDGRLDADCKRAFLRAALARLPLPEREVLLLSAWEELEPTEIAVALGVPAGTVRWRLHRARRLLADVLDPAPVAHPSPPATKEA